MPHLIAIQRALISVSDKTGLIPFAQTLASLGVQIISTGGTAKALADAGIDVTAIDQVTDFPEMMDGRVKTLHPRIHGGLLALRDNDQHVASMKEHGIKPIDLVCVNLYPFEQTVASKDVTDAQAIEQIDIGGPSMVRSAAKNHRFVTVVTDPNQYEQVTQELATHRGSTTYALRRSLMHAAFARTASYDTAIAKWISEQDDATSSQTTCPGGTSDNTSVDASVGTPVDTVDTSDDSPHDVLFPALRNVTLHRLANLRYGENPHQDAAVYINRASTETSVTTATQKHGKALSFNNLYDANGALELVKEISIKDHFAAAVIKHANPCGFAVAGTLAQAFDKAYQGDELAAFGGIVAMNAPVDVATAKRIVAGQKFLEVIVAVDYQPEALALLADRWKNVRLLATGALPEPAERDAGELECKQLVGGLLVQQRDLTHFEPSAWQHVAGPKPLPGILKQMHLAMIVVKHLKSNAICLINDHQLVGAGAGQMDRVASCQISIQKAGAKAKGAVAGSDAFFPFADGPGLLIEAGVAGIVQPGGSKRDDQTIAACQQAGVTLLLTGQRHFRH